MAAAQAQIEVVVRNINSLTKLDKTLNKLNRTNEELIRGVDNLTKSIDKLAKVQGFNDIAQDAKNAGKEIDDVGKKLGFARMPLVTSVMLPVYAAYEIALAGAEIVSAAMYAADDSLKKSAGSKKPNILYQQFDWGQEALEEYYDMQEFYNSPTGKAYLEEVDFGSLFMKELEKEKLTQYSPGYSLSKTIWSLLGTMNDEPTQQYYTNWSR